MNDVQGVALMYVPWKDILLSLYMCNDMVNNSIQFLVIRFQTTTSLSLVPLT